MDKKYIKAIDYVVLVGTFISLIFLTRYAQPLVISPIDNLETTNNIVLFEFAKGDYVLIDDNPEFSSPEKIDVKDNFAITLKPGVYYWKVVGIEESEIRKITIVSKIELKMKKGESEGVYELVNGGNVRLKVDVYRNEKLEESVFLDVDENKKVEGNKFIGGENE